VLLTLGLPDIVPDDPSEFVYLVVRCRAGVWIICAPRCARSLSTARSARTLTRGTDIMDV
jgi:hypothetical protein